MENKETILVVEGDETASAARLTAGVAVVVPGDVGAFQEDALSADDAQASQGDEALSPAEMLAAAGLVDKQ